MATHHRRVTTMSASFLAAATAVMGLTVGLPGSAAATVAATTPAPVTYNQKCQSTALTQIALDRCALSELRQVQGKLAAALRTESREFGKTTTAAAQRSWLAYSKKECALEGDVNKGGTIRPLVITNCERDLTITRIEQVRAVTSGRTGATAGSATTTAPTTAGAPTTESLSEVTCPTTFGITPSPAPTVLPGRVAVSVSSAVASQLAVYSDTQGRMKLLAPKGWDCSANYGADGSGGVFVYPHGEDFSTNNTSQNANDEAVVGGESSACVGCTLALACPLFPAASASFSASFQMSCPKTRPKAESVDQISNGIVGFLDPPGVAGDGAPSGGQYPANGVMTYHPEDQDGSWEDTCTLPGSQKALCAAVLNQFITWYGSD